MNKIYPLHVNNSVGAHAGGIGWQYYHHRSGWAGNHNWGSGTNHQFSALFSQSIASLGSYHAMGSDRRIKKNIIDVPDDLALEQIRNIPCRYYGYIDTVERGEGDGVIGFIAQEVESAFESEGLNVFEYGIVGKDTWYEATEIDEEGNLHTSDEPKDGYVEKTEHNVRYSELLAFVISAM